jgi:hypothetical protein
MPAKMTGEMMIPGKSLGTAVAEGEGVGQEVPVCIAGPLSLTPASFDACSSSRKSSSVKALVQKGTSTAKMTGEMMIPGKSLGTAVAEGEGVGQEVPVCIGTVLRCI